MAVLVARARAASAYMRNGNLLLLYVDVRSSAARRHRLRPSGGMMGDVVNGVVLAL